MDTAKNYSPYVTCVHVRHCEVHCSLPDGGDGHINDRHVRLLRPQLLDHPCPLTIFKAAIRTVRLKLKFKFKFHLF